MKIGHAGRGRKVHVVNVFHHAEGHTVLGIYCGSQQFNGSGNGGLRMDSLREFDLSKVTCKKCLKILNDGSLMKKAESVIG